jgi:two-component system, LytTR family, sensor kinase
MNIKKLKISFFIFSLWLLWVMLWAFVLSFQEKELSFFIALVNSVHYNFIFAILSLLVWKLCKRFYFENVNKILFVFLHLLLGMIFTFVWHAISYGWWYWLVGSEIFEWVRFRTTIGWQLLFGLVLYYLIVGVFYTIIYYRNYKQQQLHEAELKILTREAELKALRLQMNPHFLFNSLNSINALITQNPTLARTMISRLSELLRMSLDSHDKSLIPLQEELDFVHKYLEIEQIRFKDKMVYHENIDPALMTKLFPSMLLQPLIENAVKHGITNNRSGGTIELSIKNIGNRIAGEVINRSQDRLIAQTSIKEGTGLNNLKQRLDCLYGTSYSWHIDQSEPTAFKVHFEIPIING